MELGFNLPFRDSLKLAQKSVDRPPDNFNLSVNDLLMCDFIVSARSPYSSYM